MKKLLQKIAMLLAVVTVLSHSSIAQLDHNFAPASAFYKCIKLSTEYAPVTGLSHSLQSPSSVAVTHYGWYKEYPPPGIRFSSFLHRGPPAA
jgi:hypothetical protein